jgi:hypothetical protein
MSEFLSMNCLMGGMIPMSTLAWMGVAEAHDPLNPLFWFRMSIALMTGFVVAYPMNWWLVANHLKHGMMTVRHTDAETDADAMPGMDMSGGTESSGKIPMGHDMRPGNTAQMAPTIRPPLAVMALVSILVLLAGLVLSWAFGGLSAGG